MVFVLKPKIRFSLEIEVEPVQPDKLNRFIKEQGILLLNLPNQPLLIVVFDLSYRPH